MKIKLNKIGYDMISYDMTESEEEILVVVVDVNDLSSEWVIESDKESESVSVSDNFEGKKASKRTERGWGWN